MTLKSLSPDEVKDRTGFTNIVHLLQYSAITYGGYLDEMIRTATKLDWLEELMLFYEFGQGWTNVRQKDYAKTYNINRDTMVKDLLYRLQIELKCRERWPMYATHEEDMKFCEEKWNKEFGDNGPPPVIMHDTTNIKMAK